MKASCGCPGALVHMCDCPGCEKHRRKYYKENQHKELGCQDKYYKEKHKEMGCQDCCISHDSRSQFSNSTTLFNWVGLKNLKTTIFFYVMKYIFFNLYFSKYTSVLNVILTLQDKTLLSPSKVIPRNIVVTFSSKKYYLEVTEFFNKE